MSSTTHIHLNGGGEHTVRYLTTHRSEPFVSVQVSRDPAARFDVFVTSEAQADALIVAFIQAKKLLTGEPGHVAISEHTAAPRAVPAAKCWHPATCSEFGHEHPHIDDAVTPPGQSAPLDSESWTCAGCGGTFIGHRPAGDRCPACQPAADADGYLTPLPGDPPWSVAGTRTCWARNDIWTCTAISHDGGNHVAYSHDGRICLRWPATVPAGDAS